MKLFLLITFGFSSLAFAGIPAKHLELCAATKQPCNIVIVPQREKVISGICTGKFQGVPCVVNFSLKADNSSLKLKCNALNDELATDTLAYKVAALISEEDESQTFVEDKSTYIKFSSWILSLELVERDGEILEHSLKFKMGAEALPFTDTECK